MGSHKNHDFSKDQKMLDAYLKGVGMLDPSIPLHNVAGNHDVPERGRREGPVFQYAQEGKFRNALKQLIASLVLTEEGMKIALSGSVNREALGSTLFVAAPPHGLSPPVADIVSAPSGPPSLAEPDIVSGSRSLIARAARSLRVRMVRRKEKGRLSIR
jgi:hypothetical protein